MDAPPHEPFLRRLRRAGRDPKGFRGRRPKAYLLLGVLLLAALVTWARLSASASPDVQRLATLLSLVFLLSALGLWFGMAGRAFPVAGVLVVVAYGATSWTRFAFDLSDIFLLSLVVGFALFALAGVYLVLVLEEMVYDAHRLLHLRRRAWSAVPFAFVVAVSVALPWWEGRGGPALPATWASALASSLLLGAWWFVRVFNPMDDRLVVRELHLLVVAAVGAGVLLDALALLRGATGLLPGVLAYAVLIGTWVYVSYTTLQRTQFLLPARDPLAWLSLVLSASFAILAHSEMLYSAEGRVAVQSLVTIRVHYLIAGVWIGISLLVLRGLFRVLRLAARNVKAARVLDGGASRLTSTLVATETALGDVAVAVYRGIDRVLPGEKRDPMRPHYGRGWELEQDTLRALEEE